MVLCIFDASSSLINTAHDVVVPHRPRSSPGLPCLRAPSAEALSTSTTSAPSSTTPLLLPLSLLCSVLCVWFSNGLVLTSR